MLSRNTFVLAVLVSLLFLVGCEPLTTNELQHEAGAIHSTAAEGALLADGVARQRTLSSFAGRTRRSSPMRRIRALESSTTRPSPTPCGDLRDGRSTSPPGPPQCWATSSSRPATRSGRRRIESKLNRLAAAATRLEDSL